MSSPPPQIGQGLRRLNRCGPVTAMVQTDPYWESAASAAHGDRCSRAGSSPKSRQRPLGGNSRVQRLYSSKVMPPVPASAPALRTHDSPAARKLHDLEGGRPVVPGVELARQEQE